MTAANIPSTAPMLAVLGERASKNFAIASANADQAEKLADALLGPAPIPQGITKDGEKPSGRFREMLDGQDAIARQLERIERALGRLAQAV